LLSPQVCIFDTNYNYRLPSDDELKILVDLTLDTLTFNGSISEERLAQYAWYGRTSDYYAHEVYTKDPVLGLCDILGNIWELTSTWENTSPVSSYHMMSGGSWHYIQSDLRSAFRAYYGSGNRSGAVGFREI